MISKQGRQYAQLSIDRVIKQFSTRYHQAHSSLLSTLQSTATHAQTDYQRMASLLLHRLIMLYFIQQHGLLDHDVHYLRNRFQCVRHHYGPDHFYHCFLLPLFHDILSRPHQTGTQSLFGDVPYLGDSLFAGHPLDADLKTLVIPDTTFSHLFAFFDSYHWCLDEQQRLQEQTITPGILSLIFEQHNQQHKSGTYYTREDITSYIAKNTIIPHLFTTLALQVPTIFRPVTGICWQRIQETPERYIYTSLSTPTYLPLETADEHVSRQQRSSELYGYLSAGHIESIDGCITCNLDIILFAQDTLRSLRDPQALLVCMQQLTQMSILDPTCGSGAFLFAAIAVLTPLYEACLDAIDTVIGLNGTCPTELESLVGFMQHPFGRAYAILYAILTKNLYGVDSTMEAVDICRYCLLLKLLALLPSGTSAEPLPSLTQQICTGNTLVGFVRHALTTASTTTTAAALQAQLDLQLASTYGVDLNNTGIFTHWRSTHQPFHWEVAFPDVMARGGFDVIIGNPPYVEYEASTFPYQLRGFLTLPCGNLYPCVVERCRQLLAPHGRNGMILPLSAFATRNMRPFIEYFYRWFPRSWLSFYHFRPSMLFSGSKVASIPTAIYLATTDEPEQRFSTTLIKWGKEYREHLFSSLSYCMVAVSPDPLNRHYYPKFGRSLENGILQKILQHTPVQQYLSPAKNENAMFYRSAGGLYWKVFINFPWPYTVTSNKHCHFYERFDRDIFVALYNSSLFWWYYTTTFDTFNVKDYMLFGFRFTYPDDPHIQQALKVTCQHLMQDFQRHAKHLQRGQSASYTLYARKSKAIIDDIDAILARHYGLTTEEYTFITSYDLKYRLGTIHHDT